MCASSSSLALCSATPSNTTAPSLGRSSPAQIAISVVLPLPDGPTIAQVLPSSMTNDTSLRTLTLRSPLLKTLPKCSTLKMASLLMRYGSSRREI